MLWYHWNLQVRIKPSSSLDNMIALVSQNVILRITKNQEP